MFITFAPKKIKTKTENKIKQKQILKVVRSSSQELKFCRELIDVNFDQKS